MAILELQSLGRVNVGWLGANPPLGAITIFESRGFNVLREAITTFSPIDPKIVAGLAAVVIVHRPDWPSAFHKIAQGCVRDLLDRDCRVFVVPEQLNGLPQVYQSLATIRVCASNLPQDQLRNVFSWQRAFREPLPQPPFPYVAIHRPNAPWSELANSLLQHRPGQPVNDSVDLSCDHGSAKIRQNTVLLKRAFAGYDEVHFVEMPGGRSGVAVYQAYPILRELHTAPRFVKLGERNKIFQEFQQYQLNVERFIPFNLGPRLNYDMCCLGADQGVIVGDLLEGCESLKSVARHGRAGPAIACLFDRTLQAWYQRVEERDVAFPACPGIPAVPVITGARWDLARQYGARHDRAELTALLQRCTSTPTLFARIHGDLHVDNVQVRGHEALLIDFYANREGPIVLDSATLEASLLVDAFHNSPAWSVQEWRASVEKLYNAPKINMLPVQGKPSDPHRWFHDVVRQIRHYASRIAKPEQYAAALALALLIKACKDPNTDGAEHERRAMAQVFGELLLVNNFDKH